MKVIIAVLGFAAFAAGASLKPAQSAGLPAAIAELSEVLKFDEAKAIVERYLKSDEEVQAIWNYFGSDNFHAAVAVVDASQNVRDFVAWVEITGYPIVALINEYAEIFDWPITPFAAQIQGKSWLGLVEEIEALVGPQLEEFLATITALAEENSQFHEFIVRIVNGRPEVQRIRATPEIQQVGEDLGELGVTVEIGTDAVEEAFDWLQSLVN